ncbi:hypothetical protein KF913_03440 [Candidatus Obscuribacterales bacterium]|nr:hypothetical protein [Candidatus Obscuribacterales bacterium]
MRRYFISREGTKKLNAENENKDNSPETKIADAEATLKLEATSEPTAAEIATASASTTTSNTGRREDRKNWATNVNQTLEYIGKISNDKSLHFRSSDKLTSKLLIGAFLLAVGFAALPFFEMNAIAAIAYLLADVLLFGAILVFVISRFGIIRAMDPRHALVCWHLMVGTGLLALVIGFNIVAACVVIMMRERLQLLFPGG